MPSDAILEDLLRQQVGGAALWRKVDSEALAVLGHRAGEGELLEVRAGGGGVVWASAEPLLIRALDLDVTEAGHEDAAVALRVRRVGEVAVEGLRQPDVVRLEHLRLDARRLGTSLVGRPPVARPFVGVVLVLRQLDRRRGLARRIADRNLSNEAKGVSGDVSL